MFRSLILHITLISVFILCGTFQCLASFDAHVLGDDTYIKISTSGNECPREQHHRGYVENISTLLTSSGIKDKESPDTLHFCKYSQNNQTDEIEIYGSSLYTSIHRDRQGFFFTDTIRLLL